MIIRSVNNVDKCKKAENIEKKEEKKQQFLVAYLFIKVDKYILINKL